MRIQSRQTFVNVNVHKTVHVGLKHSAMIDQIQQEQEAVQIFSLYMPMSLIKVP